MNGRPVGFTTATMATTALLLVTAQLTMFIAFALLVVGPQTRRSADLVAESIAAMSELAERSSPQERAAMIARIDRLDTIDVMAGQDPPATGGRRPGPLERVFMQSLVDSMRHQDDMLWRSGPGGRLWMQVRIGPDYYWLSSNVPRAMQPLTALAWISAITLMLSLAAAWLIHSRLTAPLSALSDRLARLDAWRPDDPLPISRIRELATVQTRLNEASERLAENEHMRVLMLAGVSHDLRTPLTKLRLLLELSIEPDSDDARAAQRQIEVIDRLLSNFLLFGRGFDAEPERLVDLASIVAEIAAYFAAEEHVFALRIGAAPPITTRPEAVRRALVNLAENAVRYGAPPFELSLETEGGTAVLSVRDRGPGVSAADLARLSEPFFRGDTARGSAGSGLGLAIADQAVRACGAALRLSNHADHGFVAAIVLPLRHRRAGFLTG
jgi:two-component system osmolarity sensor histidine kinase EnvZ